jgi:hypothetical protein
MIDITRKDLSKQYPVYTKAGNIWKNRIDWNSILKPGTVVSTHFGIFTFVNTYKENKVWYIILSDGVNNYTVKRQQARNNKKLPKNSKVQQIIYLANVDILDSLIAEVTEVRKAYNRKNSTKADEKPLSNDTLQKLSYILDILGIDEELYNNYKRQLVNYYHPDKNKNADPSIMELLNFLFDMYRHSKQFIRRSWVSNAI